MTTYGDLTKISILCPTRGRPYLFSEMLRTLYFTRSDDTNVEVIVMLDPDDSAFKEYEELITGPYRGLVNITTIINEDKKPLSGELWNQLAQWAKGNVLMLANDDMAFRTKKWDLKVFEAFSRFQDRIAVVWCNDLQNGPKHAVFPMVHRNWYEKLGYFTPSGDRSVGTFFNDTWIFDLGKRIGRLAYVQEATIEHLHFSAGKTKFDRTHKLNRLHSNSVKSKQLFDELQHVRVGDATTLTTLFKTISQG